MRDYISDTTEEAKRDVSEVLDKFIESDSLISNYPSEILDKSQMASKPWSPIMEKPVALK